MKKILASLLFTFLFFQSFYSQSNDKGKFYGTFEYDVKVNNRALGMHEWYNSLMEDRSYQSLFDSLRAAIFSGRAKAKTAAYDSTFLSIEETKDRFLLKRISTIMDPEGNFEHDTILTQDIDLNSGIILRFNEDWYFNRESNLMTKVVKGIGIGYSLDDDRCRILVYIPLNTPVSFTANIFVPQFYYDANLLKTMESEGRFRFFSNALLAKAQNDHLLIHETRFPFTKSITEEAFKSAAESLFSSYDFGFQEEWNFDTKAFAFSKKVHAIVLRKQLNSDMNSRYKRQGVYVFRDFNPYTPDKKNINISCVTSCNKNFFLPDTVILTAMDSAKLKAIGKFTKKIDQKIRQKEMNAYSAIACPDGISTVMNIDEYKSRYFKMIRRLSDDAENPSDEANTIMDSSNIVNILAFDQSFMFDLTKLFLYRPVNSISMMSYNMEKGFAFPLFNILNAPDEKNAPDESKLLCRDITGEFNLNYFYPQLDSADGLPLITNILDYRSTFPAKERYELIYSIFQLGIKEKLKICKPGTDSVMTKKELINLQNTLTLPDLAGSDLPSWPLPVSFMQSKEDWYYDELKNNFFIRTKELTFCRKEEPAMQIIKLFTLKLN